MASPQQLEAIIELAAVLARQTDFQEILRLVTDKARIMFGARTALIMMINPTTGETIKTIYRQGEPGGDRQYQLLHTYLTGWVIENDKGIFAEDISQDPRIRTELFVEIPVRSVLCCPFRGDGIIIGSLLILSPSREMTENADPLPVLERFSAIASPFLRNLQKLQPYFESPLPESTLIRKYQGYGLIGNSAPFVDLLQSVEAASKSDVRVLLEGESGTGKELVARAIHHGSARSSEKFIAIDCGAIQRDLIESELFGHARGAFTGAAESRKGLLEEANKGTLFMDEISNLPMEMQTKLLRVLQENEVRPLGSNQTRRIDVRIIAASSKPLRQLLEQGEFREDLFFRLYVYPIEIPSLRQRVGDIPILCNHFLRRFAKKQGKKIKNISEATLDYLKEHAWNGNIRELENLVERMVTLAAPGMESLEPSLLPKEFRIEPHEEIRDEPTEMTEQIDAQIILPLHESLALHEKRAIKDALESSGWNQSAAARRLEVSEHTIRYKMKKLGIRKP